MLGVAHWITSYLVPVLFGYLVVAMALMVADHYIGVRLYAWYFRRSRPEGTLMPHPGMGFLYGQTLRRQHNRALGLSIFASVLTIVFGHFTTLELIGEFFAIFFEAWVMLPGFWLGTKLYVHVLRRQDEIFHAIDNRGEFFASIGMATRGFVMKLWGLLPGRSRPATPSSTTATTTPPAGLSAQEILRRKSEGRSV